LTSGAVDGGNGVVQRAHALFVDQRQRVIEPPALLTGERGWFDSDVLWYIRLAWHRSRQLVAIGATLGRRNRNISCRFGLVNEHVTELSDKCIHGVLMAPAGAGYIASDDTYS